MKEAMKLALEALKELVAQTEGRYFCMKHDHVALQNARFAIARLREALANEALDKKAENARELGLDYEPAPVAEPRKQEPVATLDDLEQEIYENTRQFVSRDVMEWMLKRYYTTPPQRKPLTDEQVNLFINGRGDEDDDDYVEPTGDGFGLTDADLVRLVRRVEAAHGIKENT